MRELEEEKRKAADLQRQLDDHPTIFRRKVDS